MNINSNVRTIRRLTVACSILGSMVVGLSAIWTAQELAGCSRGKPEAEQVQVEKLHQIDEQKPSLEVCP